MVLGLHSANKTNSNIVKQRSFIYNFDSWSGKTNYNSGSYGVIIDLNSQFGSSGFFGTDITKIIIQTSVIYNAGSENWGDSFLVNIRRIIDYDNFEIQIRRQDDNGNTFNASLDIFITIVQIGSII